ncbi:MAG: hypothetical protein KBD21_04440 [Candidatus Pacebacteria bacterium]|nr:hypothetical protein [Candidatus Paceibacterota bacterium]
MSVVSNNTPSAILIHGLHLQTNDWEKIVWGDVTHGQWGAIVRGVEVAWRMQAKLIVWGTGASEKEGQKESEYGFHLALSRVDDLAMLCNCTGEELKKFLEERSVCDVDTQNTRDEVRAFLDMCLSKGIAEVVLVASASHAPRSIRTALSLVTSRSEYAPFRHRVYLAPSDVVFTETTMEDVVIFERPHRGDRPKNDNHLLARRTLDILKTDQRDVYLAEWEEMLLRYEARRKSS